jgi:hypothetical protein
MSMLCFASSKNINHAKHGSRRKEGRFTLLDVAINP